MPKKTSLEELARMVSKGFDATNTELKKIDKKLDKLPAKQELWNFAHLQERVAEIRTYLRDTFNAPIK
jgi:hypothetical protein